MKKLMFTAGAVAIAAGAFARMPAVYDYKATIKHMYIKEVNASYLVGGVTKVTVKVYQKYQKTATLKGYLIHDVLGATSAYAHPGFDDNALAAPAGGAKIVQGPWHNGAGLGITRLNAPVADKVNNRAFLVVQNSAAEAQVRAPKILPAVFEAKFFDTKYSTTATWVAGVPVLEPKYTTGIAQGNLFVGGDLGAGVKEFLRNDRDDGAGTNPSIATYDLAGGGRVGTAATKLLSLGSYLDYGWTSIYLFGKFNGANGARFWDAAQRAIGDAQVVPVAGNLPNGAAIPAATRMRFYHDTWMNGTGVGKYGVVDDQDACCGFQVGDVNFGIDTLAGKLKGGLFLCSENGYDVKTYGKLANIDWEDQFYNEKAFAGYGAPVAPLVGPTYAAAGDVDQEDVWIDGDIELFTSDVLDGDWSIKKLATANVPVNRLTNTEIQNLATAPVGPIGQLAAGQSYKSTLAWWGGAEGGTDNTDLDDLNATIKGCAFALKSNVVFCRDTQIIPSIAAQTSNDRFTVPFIDRNFALAYGLMSYVRGTF